MQITFWGVRGSYPVPGAATVRYGGQTSCVEARTASAESAVDLFQDASPTDGVAITVRDNGSGMDDETRMRIFEPFFTTKEKGKGTGLGLSVVYGVVNSHGGTISVKSAPGEGTTFRLFFPTARRAAAPSLTAAKAKPAGGTEPLLIIEDEPAILHALSEYLSAAGYEIHTAVDGEEAIAACRHAATSPAAIIMDLGIPKVAPVALAKSLLEIAPDAALLAMTGYVDHDLDERIRAAGVQRVIRKPFEMEDILRVLRDVIDR